MKKKTIILIIASTIIGFAGIIYFRRKLASLLLKPEQELFIRNLNPDLQGKFRKFISSAEKEGYAVLITSGYRSFSEQAKLKRENSNNASAGHSQHNYGAAIDINMEKDGKVYSKATSRAKWEKTGIPQMAKKMGFVWGGSDFGNYHDPVHFGIKLNISKMIAEAKNKYGNNVNNIHGNKLKIQTA